VGLSGFVVSLTCGAFVTAIARTAGVRLVRPLLLGPVLNETASKLLDRPNDTSRTSEPDTSARTVALNYSGLNPRMSPLFAPRSAALMIHARSLRECIFGPKTSFPGSLSVTIYL
jgi:hypothetical protein